MKTRIIFSLLGLILCSGVIAYAGTQAKEVEIRKQGTSGSHPRAPELNPAYFSAFLTGGEIEITTVNYSGTAVVEVTGTGGSTTATVSFSETGQAVIGLSALAEGWYSIILLTGRGTYSGEFELQPAGCQLPAVSIQSSWK